MSTLAGAADLLARESLPRVPAVAPSIDSLVRALPKAELHVHLEGSTPARLAARWAQREGAEIPGLSQDPDGQWHYDFKGFAAFIQCYLALSHCITKRDDLVELSRGVAEDLRAQSVRYAEITFTPATHLARNWQRAPLLEALAASAQAAAQEQVKIAWVFDFVRSYPGTAQDTVDFAIAAREAGIPVAGFGVGGPEGDTWPGEQIRPAFDRARAAGLCSLPHAGENRGPQGVREAVELLGASRIGHGIRAIEDPQVIALLEERQVCLEICPTSNIALIGVPSLQEHPLARIQHSKVLWTLASDDPPLVGTTLNQEYLSCAKAYQWSAETLRDIAERGFRYSTLDEASKAGYIEQVRSVYQNWTESTP